MSEPELVPSEYTPAHGAREERIDVDGISVRYLDGGAGPAILFLHGALASAESWSHQIAHVSKRCRVIAPDLRGHGGSDAGREPHPAQLHAADMLALLDALGLAGVVVCGHSMGGFVGQTLALDSPERVRALVLADTSYGITTTACDRAMNAIARLYMRWTPARSLVRTFADQQGKHDAQTHAYLRAAMSRYADDKELILQVWNAVETFRSKERLERIAAPTLILSPTGNRQAWSQARYMEAIIPAARREIIADAGHMLMFDNPVGFNAALDGFLDEVSPRHDG